MTDIHVCAAIFIYQYLFFLMTLFFKCIKLKTYIGLSLCRFVWIGGKFAGFCQKRVWAAFVLFLRRCQPASRGKYWSLLKTWQKNINAVCMNMEIQIASRRITHKIFSQWPFSQSQIRSQQIIERTMGPNQNKINHHLNEAAS